MIPLRPARIHDMDPAPTLAGFACGKTSVIEVAEALRDPHSALAPLLRCIPGWKEEAVAAAEVAQVSGALTNLVYRVHSPLAMPTTVLLRVFGPGSKLFSRHQERGIFLAASQSGLGPRCLLEFANGRVEEFLPGVTLTAQTMRRPGASAAIAAALAEFHVTMFEALPLVRSASGCEGLEGSSPRADIGGERSAVFQRLRWWLAAVQEVAPAEACLHGLDAALAEVEQMEAACERRWGRSPLLACCHFDLQYGNILLLQGGEGAPPVARLIDYEYCTVGDVAFDIANHFCEYAADYHSGQAQVLDWSRLPTERQALLFCRAYATVLLGGFGTSNLARALRISAAAAGRPHGAEERAEDDGIIAAAVEVLRRRAAAFVPLSHLTWGIWGLIQAKLSEVGFDYAAYAGQRLQQYHATKAVLLDGV